ncbi:MAG: hypothetical protein EYC70_10335 [Planctomycetota bacterium]|nr:MAG: hypothetical protein EYC70_10335 [Planctomycetota bacterium]
MSSVAEEILISRIVDGNAAPADWSALAAAAASDPEVWARLARTGEAQNALRAQLERALEAADCVEIPAASSRRPRWSIWTGWAAAAALALAWLGIGWNRGDRVPAESPAGPAGFDQLAGAGSDPTTPAEPAGFLREGAPPGHFLEELPAVMVDARPASDGNGQEVYYIRRLLERARVDQMYQVNRNELGQPVAVPVSTGPAVPRPPL